MIAVLLVVLLMLLNIGLVKSIAPQGTPISREMTEDSDTRGGHRPAGLVLSLPCSKAKQERETERERVPVASLSFWLSLGSVFSVL